MVTRHKDPKVTGGSRNLRCKGLPLGPMVEMFPIWDSDPQSPELWRQEAQMPPSQPTEVIVARAPPTPTCWLLHPCILFYHGNTAPLNNHGLSEYGVWCS